MSIFKRLKKMSYICIEPVKYVVEKKENIITTLTEELKRLIRV